MTITRIFALTLVSLFYLIYLQRQFALRRRGIRVDRLGKGQKERKTRTIETILLTVSLSMPAVQYISILGGYGWPEAPLWLSTAGLAAAAAGVLFFLLAVISMRENWRAGIDASQKTRLVTRGIYRISRNPAFVGFDLLYIGIAANFPNLVLLALSLAGIVVFHLQILQEERYMQGTFGAEYVDYARKTRRYL
jgi:protein-S-isoprenylcysteine O-methyltransferase Ste14